MKIRDFRQLRELELKVDSLRFPPEILLSSIVSTELRKIIFLKGPISRLADFAVQMRWWVPMEELLCGLVDRLRETGYHHTLEVELQIRGSEDDPGKHDFVRFLPRFREKGVVTVIDAAHSNRVVHSSRIIKVEWGFL